MTPQLGLFDDDRRRAVAAGERGQDAARAGTPPKIREALSTAIHELARAGGEFTAEDVWRLVPHVDGDESYDGRVLGALLQDARRAGLIESTEVFRGSTRIACHGRPMRVWRGLCTT